MNGILHEFAGYFVADETFDIIITSEVLDMFRMLSERKELMRILEAGGLYCFTVPFLPPAITILFLLTLTSTETWYFAEPQFHADLRPEGILVYRLFCYRDMKQRFEGMGHQFKSYRFWSESLGIVGSDCWTHVVTKAARAMSTVVSS